jgi:HEAT repeat protein
LGQRQRKQFPQLPRRLLGNIGKEAVPSIITLLESNDAEVRASAVFALVLVGKDAETAVNDLEKAIQDEDPRVRARAAVALVQIDPGYAPAVSTQLNSALEYGFDDQDRETQIHATLLLGQMGEEAIEAVPALIKIAQDCCSFDAEPAVKAIIALGTIAESGQGVQMGEAVSPLVEILDSKRHPANFQPRAEAALTLGKIGQEADRVVPALIRASGDLDEDVRINAHIALGMFGVNLHDIIPELLTNLDDENVDVRRQAALSLAELGPYAVPGLLTALENGSPSARIGAAYALGNMKFSTREIVEALQAIVLAEDNDIELRRVAASSLELLGQDMQPFFEENNLVSPKNAVCPSIPFGANWAVFEYDVLTGKCRFYWRTFFYSGGEELIDALCRIFGC